MVITGLPGRQGVAPAEVGVTSMVSSPSIPAVSVVLHAEVDVAPALAQEVARHAGPGGRQRLLGRTLLLHGGGRCQEVVS